MSKELIEKLRNVGGAFGALMHEAADALEAKAAPVGEREAFIAWGKSLGLTHSQMTMGEWCAFQAGAAYQLAQQPQNAEAVPEYALRSRIADLLHLLQFAKIETSTPTDAAQAEIAMNDLEAMLASTPQPSAGVVMPERKDESKYRGTGLIAARQWNACLDEFARLNGKGVV